MLVESAGNIKEKFQFFPLCGGFIGNSGNAHIYSLLRKCRKRLEQEGAAGKERLSKSIGL
jgi:hypothetical protein